MRANPVVAAASEAIAQRRCPPALPVRGTPDLRVLVICSAQLCGLEGHIESAELALIDVWETEM